MELTCLRLRSCSVAGNGGQSTMQDELQVFTMSMGSEIRIVEGLDAGQIVCAIVKAQLHQFIPREGWYY